MLGALCRLNQDRKHNVRVLAIAIANVAYVVLSFILPLGIYTEWLNESLSKLSVDLYKLNFGLALAINVWIYHRNRSR